MIRRVAGVALAAAMYLAASELAARRLLAPRPAAVRDLPGGQRVTLTAADGVQLAAWRLDPPRDPPRGTIVLAHGYGNDRRLLSLALSQSLAARGFRVLALDFRGHGESGGDRTTLGPAEALDAAAALEHAAALGGPVGYVGFSMGAAAYLLSGREAGAAVLDSPYASLRGALASRLGHAGLLVPLSAGPIAMVSRRVPGGVDAARPVDAAARLTRPTLLLFAEHDVWVPAEAQAAYREAACARCAVEVMRGATHGGHFSGQWGERVGSFLVEALRAAR